MKSKFAKILSVSLALGLLNFSYADEIKMDTEIQNMDVNKAAEKNIFENEQEIYQDQTQQTDQPNDDELEASLGKKIFAKKIGKRTVIIEPTKAEKLKNKKYHTVNNYFIGTFRLYDDKTKKTYDFAAGKAFTYDYKQKNPPVIVDSSSLDVFISQIESFFNKGLEKEMTKAVKRPNSNKYDVKNIKIARKIDKEKFKNDMMRRIEFADYSPVKLPFLDGKVEQVYYNSQDVTLLSSYSSKYDLGDSGRSKNVQLAGEEINGTKLEPGEKFYFNKRTEPIEKHLQDAYVIMNNEFVLGKGGGLCQVSTTLFNTALECGLQIDHRRNHSKQIHYVPYGRDAMVSSSNDFVFTNNFKHPIYIVYSRPVANEIRLDIYGDKSDKKQVKTWTTGSGKSFGLHRVINGSKAQESFYSYYQ